MTFSLYPGSHIYIQHQRIFQLRTQDKILPSLNSETKHCFLSLYSWLDVSSVMFMLTSMYVIQELFFKIDWELDYAQLITGREEGKGCSLCPWHLNGNWEQSPVRDEPAPLIMSLWMHPAMGREGQDEALSFTWSPNFPTEQFWQGY